MLPVSNFRPSPQVLAHESRTRAESAWPAAMRVLLAATRDFIESSRTRGWLWGWLVVSPLFLLPNLAALVNARLTVSPTGCDFVQCFG